MGQVTAAWDDKKRQASLCGDTGRATAFYPDMNRVFWLESCGGLPPSSIELRGGNPDGLEEMSVYFVAGGVYQDYRGQERFVLMAPNQEAPPYLMIDGLTQYFTLLRHQAHIYRVEEDYTLSLVAPSSKALEWGVRAPERVRLDQDSLAKLQAVMNRVN